MRDFIERLRAHPEHIRHRIVIGASVGFTGLVGVLWMGTLLTSGTLALNLSTPGTQAPTVASVNGAVQETRSNWQQLLGAVGAANASSSAPALTPINTSTGADTTGTAPKTDIGSNQNSTKQTSIPF